MRQRYAPLSPPPVMSSAAAFRAASSTVHSATQPVYEPPHRAGSAQVEPDIRPAHSRTIPELTSSAVLAPDMCNGSTGLLLALAGLVTATAAVLSRWIG